MFNYQKVEVKNGVYVMLLLVYFIFFRNLIFLSGASTSILYSFGILMLILIFCGKKIIFSKLLILLISFPLIFIFFSDLYFRDSWNGEDWIYSLEKEYPKRFLYLIFLIFLPSLFLYSKLKMSSFFNIVAFSVFISIVFNFFIGFELNFDRGLMAKRIEPIILYDGAITALSILLLCYSFYIDGNKSYILNLIALLNIFVIFLHGSRGVWLGLPLSLLLIYFFFFKGNIKKIAFSNILLMIFLFLSLNFIPNSPIQQRIDALNADKEKIVESNNYHSSIGSRILIWKISLEKFREAPIGGIGMAEFKKYNCNLYKQGILGECVPHAHNLFIQSLVTHGVFGFFSIFLSFLIPLVYFIRKVKSNNRDIYFLGVLGIIFIFYIFVCSLTDFFFLIKQTTIFYFLIIATIISFILNKENVDNSDSILK